MPPTDPLFKAIVRATVELWQADADGDESKARAWTRELEHLIAEYRTQESHATQR